MKTNHSSPLERALAGMQSRRVVLAALAMGGAAAAIAPVADLAAKKKKKKAWRYRAQFGSEGTGDGQFQDPVGVAVSADGRTACVADTEHRISVWTRTSDTSTDWSPSTTFGSEGTSDTNFNLPYGVAVSADGRTAWVADSGNNRISVWTRPTSTSIEWSPSSRFGSGPGSGGANFKYPSGVTVSADGRTARVADANNHRISVWTRKSDTSTDWSHSITFGSEGSGNPNFSYPPGVAVSTDGRTAWVADRVNKRISIWTYS